MEATTIAPDVVLLDGDEGRVILILVMPGIDGIAIEGISIAIDLPYTGYGHCSPALVIEA